MVEDLREQVILEEELETESGDRYAGLLNLEPWQRLILTLLLFFDVALCGCMALIMMGRVLPPF